MPPIFICIPLRIPSHSLAFFLCLFLQQQSQKMSTVFNAPLQIYPCFDHTLFTHILIKRSRCMWRRPNNVCPSRVSEHIKTEIYGICTELGLHQDTLVFVRPQMTSAPILIKITNILQLLHFMLLNIQFSAGVTASDSPCMSEFTS